MNFYLEFDEEAELEPGLAALVGRNKDAGQLVQGEAPIQTGPKIRVDVKTEAGPHTHQIYRALLHGDGVVDDAESVIIEGQENKLAGVVF